MPPKALELDCGCGAGFGAEAYSERIDCLRSDL